MDRRTWMTSALAGVPALLRAAPDAAAALPKDDGYRGIWYFIRATTDKARYKYKYSGGFATYPQQHAPIAIYAKEAQKTFFCYGGTVRGKQELLHMVSYFDHRTGMVPRPTILLNKETNDAHDNPTMAIDDKGFVWIFSSSHGTTRPSYVHRSTAPYTVDSFEQVWKTNFSYTQPWHLSGQGFLFLHTRYRRVNDRSCRALYCMTSVDGVKWTDPADLAFAWQGHYQISWPDLARSRVGTAFDIHPLGSLGLDARTNLHYMQTRDFGRTWVTADGKPVPLPIQSEKNAALVRDYHAEGKLVYLKDLQYDAEGHPILVYLVSKGADAGPESGPRRLTVAHWKGSEWSFAEMGETDHNYDHGSLYLEDGGRVWRYIAPLAPGPQPWGTGGEVEALESRDAGRTWKRAARLTSGSEFNHSYVRRPLHAHPDFYALWADGSPDAESASRIYFANRQGQVFRLPAVMKAEREKPQRVG